ncbi:unnamed protein product [Symbiodinium natans]|uniref:Transmembrane protein n=1 Tax=Symbiodinium natans TaxID=878477 RepID=A0A812JAV8_9DINO|nr:unnamed protein product [Symbiodinium natans]
MLRWLVRVAGCCYCLRVASGAAIEGEATVDEDVCSVMQTRQPQQGEPGVPRSSGTSKAETAAIKAEALDRLVARTDNSSAFSEKADGSEHVEGSVRQHVRKFQDWFNSRPPEVQVLLKAVCLSWVIAVSLGLLGLACGVLRFHSPSKYISWKVLAEREAGGGFLSIPLNIFLTIASIPNSIMHLSTESRRSMAAILVFFAILFAIMWHAQLIQPVVDELASYLFVFALVGAVCVVILVDMWRRVHASLSGSFAGLRRMQQQFAHFQQRFGLGEPHEETGSLYSAASVR